MNIFFHSELFGIKIHCHDGETSDLYYKEQKEEKD